VGGIRLLLDPPPTTLDLRSETDGMIVPDPATMAAREPGIPVATHVATLPTAPLAAPVPIAQATHPSPAAAPPAAAGAPALTVHRDAPEGASGPVWFGALALVLLIGAGVGLVVVQRRSV
jgi:hypothetical protein